MTPKTDEIFQKQAKAKFRVGQVVAIRNGKLGWARIANRRWNPNMGQCAPCWEYGIRRTSKDEIDPGWQESALHPLTKRERGES